MMNPKYAGNPTGFVSSNLKTLGVYFLRPDQRGPGHGENGVIRIRTRAVDGFAEIRIGDNGCGIPEKNLTKIFDPFFTTKEVGKGTGLGLHIAYNIVKKHQGTLVVESEVGKSTTFTIRIPIERLSLDPSREEQ